jgi:hypothetical protein
MLEPALSAARRLRSTSPLATLPYPVAHVQRESGSFIGLRVIGSCYSQDTFRIRDLLSNNWRYSRGMADRFRPLPHRRHDDTRGGPSHWHYRSMRMLLHVTSHTAAGDGVGRITRECKPKN